MKGQNTNISLFSQRWTWLDVNYALATSVLACHMWPCRTAFQTLMYSVIELHRNWTWNHGAVCVESSCEMKWNADSSSYVYICPHVLSESPARLLFSISSSSRYCLLAVHFLLLGEPFDWCPSSLCVMLTLYGCVTAPWDTVATVLSLVSAPLLPFRPQ